MGSVHSPLSDHHGFTFKPFPTRPLKGATVVRIGTLFVAKGANGVLYGSGPLAKRVAHVAGDWWFQNDMLTALERLGVITKEVVREWRRVAEEDSRRNNAQHALDSITEELSEFDLDLSPKQRRVLEQIARGDS